MPEHRCQTTPYRNLVAWWQTGMSLVVYDLHNRVRPRFFDQVGHKTKSCHRQTYQNYKQSRQKLGTFPIDELAV